MAIYKLFPEKDATIYSGFPVMNTGIDEILEVSTFYDTTSPEVSRFLIQFSQTEIEDVLDNKVGSAQFQTNLKTFLADVTGLNQTTTLDVESEFKDDIVELIIDEAVSILAGDIESVNQSSRGTQNTERNN